MSILDRKNIADASEQLKKFYDSVRERCKIATSAEDRQKIIIELYEKFFKTAAPLTVERLGIVYTPVEVVDFILRAVNDVLKEIFGKTLSSKGVHILDPFASTGTFIVRLIQSDLIKPRDLMRKYFNKLHTNEIILLAHYIATINIENAFHDRVDAKNYQPFERICFTDTFQAYEQDDNAKGQTDFKDNEIYIFNLRGDIRAKERADSKRDGENVFNIMTGVAITILVKNHEHIGDAKIFYKDIGDYLKREQKFNEQNLYYDNGLNERHYKMSKIFPTGREENLLICVTGANARKNFSAMITDKIPCLDTIKKCQCFALYYYERAAQGNLFGENLQRRDGISDFILNRAQNLFGDVSKEDIFHYV